VGVPVFCSYMGRDGVNNVSYWRLSRVLQFLRERGDKWNECRGLRRVGRLACWGAWEALSTSSHPLAHGQRVRAVAELVRSWLHRHQHRRLLCEDPTGVLLAGPAHLVARYTSLGLYDLPEKAFVVHAARPGDVVLDVGAFIGTFTLPIAARGASVHAFEPVEESRRVLADNVRLNGLEHLVTMHDFAVSDIPGRATITTGFGSGNRVVGEDVASLSTATVQMTTLDAWAEGRDLEQLLLIKIDAEGMDEQVLAGATNLLRHHEPALIMEYWDGTATLRARLADVGYAMYRYDLCRAELVAMQSATGWGNLIACTPSRYQMLSARLAERCPQPLSLPRINWASAAASDAWATA
jgi:FkbM family methyltransferase